MKVNRSILSWGGVVLFGGLIGLFFAQWQMMKVEENLEYRRADPSTGEVVVDLTLMPEPSSGFPQVQLPEGAIEDEMVLHFSHRREYLAYLKALANAGLAPLGKIDELLVVRVGADVMSGPRPGRYGAQGCFSYRVQRPPSPAQLAPELYARLHPFHESAGAIVGKPVADGDGSGVMVGILDSGIKAHQQFDDKYIVHIDLVGGGVAGPGAAHGTAVASIIAGSEGIAPAAELFVVRVLDDQGMGNSFDVAEGIVQAVDLGVKVLNLSLGVYQDSQLLRQAVRYAHAHNVILVAAAGNDGHAQMPYPAAYPEVLSVTAVDGQGTHALFPNQSAEIDFAAPGVGVVTAKEAEGTMLFSGTSAAAPFVTGTLASILSSSEVQTATQAVNLLKRYLDDAGAPGVDPAYGGGLVNWDRLRERDTAAVHDVALADIYLSPQALPGTAVPVEVTVQNRGTSWLVASTLRVQVGGEAAPMDFTIGTLGPGRTTTRKVYTRVPPEGSTETLQIAAEVRPENNLTDVRLDNNVKAVQFSPRQP